MKLCDRTTVEEHDSYRQRELVEKNGYEHSETVEKQDSG